VRPGSRWRSAAWVPVALARHHAIARRRLLSVGFVVLLGACAQPAPSVSAPQAVLPVPILCVGVPVAQCQAVAVAALGALPDGHLAPAHVEVGPLGCRASPCPQALVTGGDVGVIVRFASGPPRAIEVTALDESLQAADAGDPSYFEVKPLSARAPGPGPHPFSLGHCGIWTPIDFDGSLWDPIGAIAAESSDATNGSDGLLVMTSPTTAVYTSTGGFHLDLMRHIGTGFYPGCS